MNSPLTSPNAANNGHNGHSRTDRPATGRRSLFAFYPDDEQVDDPSSVDRWGGTGRGREALFSGPRRRRGMVTVECSSCEARTPVWPPRLLGHMIPSVWIPGRSLRWWMRCPACNGRNVCHLDTATVLKAG